MTLCGSYGTTKFTLVFSGTTLGDQVHSIRTQRQLATPVKPRHNLWATSVVLDGAYPAVYWQHSISVYNEEASRAAYASWFWQLDQYYTDAAYSLEIRDLEDNVVVSFGDCQLFADSQTDPADLFLTSSGLVELQFYGTSCPSLN